jgi:SET domain-containing protein
VLLVPTFVHPSDIAGVGLFARYRIPKGTVVWRYNDDVDWHVPVEAYAQMDSRRKEFFDTYACQPYGREYLEVCGDFAMFFNHSSTPNCDDSDERITVALRDIEAGEEMTCDYRLFESRPIPFLDHGGQPWLGKNENGHVDRTLATPTSSLATRSA